MTEQPSRTRRIRAAIARRYGDVPLIAPLLDMIVRLNPAPPRVRISSVRDARADGAARRCDGRTLHRHPRTGSNPLACINRPRLWRSCSGSRIGGAVWSRRRKLTGRPAASSRARSAGSMRDRPPCRRRPARNRPRAAAPADDRLPVRQRAAGPPAPSGAPPATRRRRSSGPRRRPEARRRTRSPRKPPAGARPGDN